MTNPNGILAGKVNTPATETKTAIPEVKTAQAEEKRFQHYASAKQSIQLLTERGKKICFIGFKFITDDPDCIEYLNREIKDLTLGITKGKLLTAEEADPMSAYKKKVIAEYLAKQIEAKKAEAAGEFQDMGSTAPGNKAAISPSSSREVTNAGPSS